MQIQDTKSTVQLRCIKLKRTGAGETAYNNSILLRGLPISVQVIINFQHINSIRSVLSPFFAECYIVPSQGVCRSEERETFYTYSTKTNTCVRIFGCYGIRDRNVYLTRKGCEQACSGDIPVQPVTPSVDFGTVEIVSLPDNPNYKIAPGRYMCNIYSFDFFSNIHLQFTRNETYNFTMITLNNELKQS